MSFVCTVRFAGHLACSGTISALFVFNANRSVRLHKTTLETVYLFISIFGAPGGEISGSCSLRVVFRSVAMK